MATPAQLAEKLRQDRLGVESKPDPIVERARSGPTPGSLFATPGQLAEKNSPSATPAQLAEKASFATPAQLAEKSLQNRPPPLPPRGSSATVVPPPAYSRDDERRSELISQQWNSTDPRSSSTHSLVPSESQRDGRRKLLLVFIHGFMGNELSFQSFPAHAHNLLTIALAETHVVHTKLYPRYKSRNSIQSARDDFSNWLEPHENPETDVVLLGHSMGGILAAEVVLQQSSPPTNSKPLRHRILGMIGFDTPFLGMHPGVVVSGIGSLFRPAPEPPGVANSQSGSGITTPMGSHASAPSPGYAASSVSSVESSQPSLVQSIASPLASPPINDPNFNAPFVNDVHIQERKGWNSLLHFVNKHSDGLVDATKSYFMSHIEFGSCLADYPGMKIRYEKVRALEDAKDSIPGTGTATQVQTRKVRFLNYYTASTGRPKVPKAPKFLPEETTSEFVREERQRGRLNVNSDRTPTPSITVHEHSGGAVTPRQLDEAPTMSQVEAEMQNLGNNSGIYDADDEPPEMRHIDSMPINEDEEEPQVLHHTQSIVSEISSYDLHSTKSEPILPPLPEIPIEPEPVNLDAYTDKDERKLAEREHKRVMKVYQQALKDRESAIKDRKKIFEKREKRARQEAEKRSRAEEKQKAKEEKEAAKRRQQEEKAMEKGRGICMPRPEEERSRHGSSAASLRDEKPKRDKKFCMLPPTIRGKVDKCWVRIYMEGVDEVGAHCGLFFAGPQYESLVGDLGARIEQWVMDAAATRAALASRRF